MRFNSSQRAALLALAKGTLQHGEHGWLAEADGVQLLPDRIVRWLFGEGFLTRLPGSTAAYQLNGRGSLALQEAQAEERTRETEGQPELSAVPLLLLGPAAHSEELDYLLVIPFAGEDADRHRSRLRQLAPLQGAERFEFVQFRDEVFALPLSPRLAELGLLPDAAEGLLFLPDRLPADLGLRHCPDRGVNYGAGWLQWFGGFDSESPLIVSGRIPAERFERAIEGTS